MEYRILGKDLKVSEIGFGCMGLSHAYGKPVEKKEGIRLLREAVEMGYTFLDTAEVYGTPEDPHQNEKLLGEALPGRARHCQLFPRVDGVLIRASLPRPSRSWNCITASSAGEDHAVRIIPQW